VTTTDPRPIPGTVPRDEAFTRPFWQAAAEGRLTTTRCRPCGRLQFPPRIVCVHCWGRDSVWQELGGTGVLASFTEIHAGPAVFAEELPYTIGLVDLDEGLRVAARIDARFTDLRLADPVAFAARSRNGTPLLTFVPTNRR
jgi:uncharacterized OB-fold protein